MQITIKQHLKWTKSNTHLIETKAIYLKLLTHKPVFFDIKFTFCLDCLCILLICLKLWLGTVKNLQ